MGVQRCLDHRCCEGAQDGPSAEERLGMGELLPDDGPRGSVRRLQDERVWPRERFPTDSRKHLPQTRDVLGSSYGPVGFLCIGVYSVSYAVIDLYVLPVLGVAGYFLIHCGFPIAPILLGLILGSVLEENFRRSLLVQRGDFMGFFYRPISGTLLVLTAILLIAALTVEARCFLKTRRQRDDGQPAE